MDCDWTPPLWVGLCLKEVEVLHVVEMSVPLEEDLQNIQHKARSLPSVFFILVHAIECWKILASSESL